MLIGKVSFIILVMLLYSNEFFESKPAMNHDLANFVFPILFCGDFFFVEVRRSLSELKNTEVSYRY